jgi:hypothetical protein
VVLFLAMSVGDALEIANRVQDAVVPMRMHTSERDPGQPLTARFTYWPLDPYAVEVVFRPTHSRGKKWTLSRELLLDGLDHSVGDGDVIIWPETGSASQDPNTFIRLRSSRSTALLSAPRTELKTYLDATQKNVARGEEDQHMKDAMEKLERGLALLAGTGRSE